MNRLPADAETRAARRQMYIDKAAARAALAERSIKCRLDYPDISTHADVPNGCRNDGSSCLCPCHDNPPGTP